MNREDISIRRRENSRKWRKRIKDAGYVIVHVITRPEFTNEIKVYANKLNSQRK